MDERQQGAPVSTAAAGGPLPDGGKGRATHIVGIGASAGGLEALERFFSKMPPDRGLAFIVVQHLSPDFKSMMDELLARHTALAIHRVEDGMAVERDSIYLIPPKKEMIISGGTLFLKDRGTDGALSLPVDVFLLSLAQDSGSSAVGIILSGTGSDGSRGVRAIHDAGGLVLVQREDTAKFDSMPRAAIDTGAVHYVLPPEAMPEALLDYVSNPCGDTEPAAATGTHAADECIDHIFTLLRDHFGIDFAHYKPATVTRRIDRRLSMTQAVDLEDYVRKVQEDPEELSSLYKDLLIGVTQFFRDPEAFARLEHDIIPGLLAKRASKDELRIWVAGCATGEEAYSLAILFHERLTAMRRPVNVKIFATDVHRASLAFASAGIFSADSLRDVPSARLEYYFTRRGDHYHVSKELRRMIVFAPHNVIRDAPFTKMDLTSCRNLLIYLEPRAQQRVLSLFHFSLRVGGVLFLGPSESITPLSGEFETLDEHWRLFRKKRDVRLCIEPRMQLCPPGAAVHSPLESEPAPSSGAHVDMRLLRVYDALLAERMPAGVLINERRELVHCFGEARTFLHPSAGRSSLDILDLVDGELRTALAAAIQRTAKEHVPVVYRGVRVNSGTKEMHVTLTTRAFPDRHTQSTFILVSLDPMIAPPAAIEDPGEFDAGNVSRERIGTLETELRYTKENLQATIEELETSNEELQATNEELLSSNEQLQSTNEELHSVNEELYTVNAEYQRKIEELTELTNDMENLLRSTDIGTIFLDEELQVRKFTPAAAQAFNLLPQDTGRPISHISHNIDHPVLLDDVRRVLEGGRTEEKEVLNREGVPFLMRIQAYRAGGKSADGVVLTFVDLSSVRRAERALRESEQRLQGILASVPDQIRIIDREYNVIWSNDVARCQFGADQTGRKCYSLCTNRPTPCEACPARQVFADGRPCEMERKCRLPDGKERTLWCVANPASRDENGRPDTVIEVIRDVTDHRRALDKERRFEQERLDSLLLLGRMATAPAREIRDFALREAVRQTRSKIGYLALMDAYETPICVEVRSETAADSGSDGGRPDSLPAAADEFWREAVRRRAPVITNDYQPSNPSRGAGGCGDSGCGGPGSRRQVRRQMNVPVFEGDRIVVVVGVGDKDGEYDQSDVRQLTLLMQSMWLLLQQRQAEDALKKARDELEVRVAARTSELKRSNDELEQFAYVASHDLKEPLRMVSSYVKLLAEEYAGRLDEEADKYIRYAVDGATRMQTLIDDLLAFSRIGKTEEALSSVSLASVAAAALANLESAVRESGARVEIAALPTVVGYEPGLTQLLQNLISNAIKFRGKERPLVKVFAVAREHEQEIVVQDNGPGIQPEFHDRIFRLFQRLHGKQDYPGTGIGLAICRKIVECHGGRIWVESEPGKGAAFHFTLASQTVPEPKLMKDRRHARRKTD